MTITHHFFFKKSDELKTEQISKSKKGHNSVKIVMYSCLQMEIIMINKCSKFKSHMSNSFDKTWTCMETEAISKSKMGHNSAKIDDRVMFSFLQIETIILNK